MDLTRVSIPDSWANTVYMNMAYVPFPFLQKLQVPIILTRLQSGISLSSHLFLEYLLE